MRARPCDGSGGAVDNTIQLLLICSPLWQAVTALPLDWWRIHTTLYSQISFGCALFTYAYSYHYCHIHDMESAAAAGMLRRKGRLFRGDVFRSHKLTVQFCISSQQAWTHQHPHVLPGRKTQHRPSPPMCIRDRKLTSIVPGSQQFLGEICSHVTVAELCRLSYLSWKGSVITY